MIQKCLHIIPLILSFSLFAVSQVQSQEFPGSLQYATNLQRLNPAFVGMWGKSGIYVSSRTSWVGINKAPLSQQFTWYSSVKNQKSAFGFNLERQSIGRENRLFFTADYSCLIRLDWSHYFRFGLKSGIVNFDNSLKNYQLYPDFISDPEYANNVRLYYMTVFGIGAIYFCDNYYLSCSIPQVIVNGFKVNRSDLSNSPELVTAYFSGGYVFQLPKSIRIRPSILLVKTAGKSLGIDVSALIYWPENLQLGVGLRNDGFVCFSGQYSFRNNLKVGYAIGYSMTPDIRKYQLGSGEITLQYVFNPNKRMYVKPTYF